MALSPEYVTLLRAGIAAAPEWNDAWVRANDYLDALRMQPDLDRELILLSSFERAIARKRAEPFIPATQLGFEEMQRSLDRVFGHLVREDTDAEARSVEERLRLYLTETDGHGAFHRREAIQRDVLEALREVRLETSPALQPATITAKPLEFTGWGGRLKEFAEQVAPSGNNRILAWILGLGALALLVFTSL